MLLPSSASNPANMIAQALTMYKGLVNVSSNGHHETRVGIESGAKVGGSSAETGDESTTNARADEKGHLEEPKFSLQSHKKLD